jgi:hypothetical protein
MLQTCWSFLRICLAAHVHLLLALTFLRMCGTVAGMKFLRRNDATYRSPYTVITVYVQLVGGALRKSSNIFYPHAWRVDYEGDCNSSFVIIRRRNSPSVLVGDSPCCIWTGYERRVSHAPTEPLSVCVRICTHVCMCVCTSVCTLFVLHPEHPFMPLDRLVTLLLALCQEEARRHMAA